MKTNEQNYESEKISTIIKDGKFQYNGVTYTLDLSQTQQDPSNMVSAARMYKKLIGFNDQGQYVKAFPAHCSVVGTPVGVTEELPLVSDNTGVTDEPVVTYLTVPEPDVEGNSPELASIEAEDWPEVEPDPEPVADQHPRKNKSKRHS